MNLFFGVAVCSSACGLDKWKNPNFSRLSYHSSESSSDQVADNSFASPLGDELHAENSEVDKRLRSTEVTRLNDLAMKNNSLWRSQEEEESSEDEGGSEAIADRCSDAPWISNGRWYSSLSGTQNEMPLCGQNGPDGFYRLRMPARGDLWVQGFARDFSPKIAVMTGTCMAEPTFLCLQDTGAYLLNLAAGTELVIGVSASWEDSVGSSTGEEESEEGVNDEFHYAERRRAKSNDKTTGKDGDEISDPMEFYLDVSLRRILGAGQICRPLALGRCESGTHCLSDSEFFEWIEHVDGDHQRILVHGPSSVESWRCRPIPGETCDLAQGIDVEGTSSAMIDPRNNYHDDHDHSCGGLRMRDQVLRFRFSPNFRKKVGEIPPEVETIFRIWTDHPGVGLAVREPGCLRSAERQCAPYGTNGAEIELNNFREMLARDAKPFVILDYAAAPLGPQQPFTLHWSLVDASAI